MTEEEWVTSTCASNMLAKLHKARPRFLRTQIPQLHRFFIACCWKHEHLIPQERLRDGLRGAEKWISGEISSAKLEELNYWAEAEAFRIDYAKSAEDVAAIKILINGIEDLRALPFSRARETLLSAAYFAEGAMIYSKFRSLPWIDSLFESEFLCPDLLREFVKPKFKPRTLFDELYERIFYTLSFIKYRGS